MLLLVLACLAAAASAAGTFNSPIGCTPEVRVMVVMPILFAPIPMSTTSTSCVLTFHCLQVDCDLYVSWAVNGANIDFTVSGLAGNWVCMHGTLAIHSSSLRRQLLTHHSSSHMAPAWLWLQPRHHDAGRLLHLHHVKRSPYRLQRILARTGNSPEK